MGVRQLHHAAPCGLIKHLLIINSIIFFCHAASILQTVEIVADTLPTFSSEVTDSKYVVALDVSRTAAESEEVGGARVLAMKDKTGRKFTCLIPNITPTDEEDTMSTTESLAVAAGGAAQKKPSELLSVLDSLCLYRIDDWWTYELCYKKHVRQFHKEHDQVIADFKLGSYSDEDSDVDQVYEDSSVGGISSKYIKQVYKGGDPCDITKQPRETEVRFLCADGSQDVITSMREMATCQYRLTVSSPRLCAHPAFRAPPAPVHRVLCTLAADSAVAAAAVASGAARAGGGAAAEGEADPLGGGAGGAAVAGERREPSKELEDLRQAIKDVGEGLGVNTTSLETALLNADAAEADKVAAGQKAAAEAQSGGKAAGEATVKADKGSRSAAVGPPAPPQRDAEEEVFYYDDSDDEEDEDFDDHAFLRSGMHAEL